MKNRFFISLILALSFATMYGQADKSKIAELLHKSSAVYSSVPLYEIESSYKLYSDYKSNRILESYECLYVKNNNQSYLKMAATELISLNGHLIKIDHDSKLMQHGNDTGTDPMPLSNIKDYILNFSSFKLTSHGNNWVCTMTSPAISMLPYGQVIIYVDKDNFTISKQVLYMLTENKYRKDGKILTDYPRLEITFNSFKSRNVVLGQRFNLDKYIKKSKDKFLPSANYKGFRILD